MNISEMPNLANNKEKIKIAIKKSSEAPEEIKKNPFYDEECWGMAMSPEDIYLPDSDMAISFALATHEIGHLSNEKAEAEENIRLDDFDATAKEEKRAWDVGKKYVQDCVDGYFGDDEKMKAAIYEAIEKIEAGITEIMEWSKPMYLEKGEMNDLSEDEREEKFAERRSIFATEKLEEYKKMVDDKIKSHKLGQKVDWEKFTSLVKRSVEKIINDNK